MIASKNHAQKKGCPYGSHPCASSFVPESPQTMQSDFIMRVTDTKFGDATMQNALKSDCGASSMTMHMMISLLCEFFHGLGGDPRSPLIGHLRDLLRRTKDPGQDPNPPETGQLCLVEDGILCSLT